MRQCNKTRPPEPTPALSLLRERGSLKKVMGFNFVRIL
jgi:hypothetical protein